MGLIYRLIDVPGMFHMLRGHDFGGQTCRLRLTVEDSFLPENAASFLLGLEHGHLSLLEEEGHDCELRIDIAEFSSLLIGVVGFRSLSRYGLADISDPGYIEVVERIFAADKPVCMTAF